MFAQRAAAHPPPPPVRTLSPSVLIGRRASLRRKRSRKRRLRVTRLPDRSQKIDGRPSSFQWEQETSGPRRLITPQQDSEYGVTHCCRLAAMQTGGGGGVTEVAELFFRESRPVKTAGLKTKDYSHRMQCTFNDSNIVCTNIQEIHLHPSHKQ